MPEAKPPVSSNATKTLVCVDAYETEFTGRLYNAYIADAVRFSSAMSFLFLLEDLFDALHFPRATCHSRRFLNRPRRPLLMPKLRKTPLWHAPDCEQRGALATFLLHVQFRQGATWQGTVTWLEQEQTCRFRSTLELLHLLDSALRT